MSTIKQSNLTISEALKKTEEQKPAFREWANGFSLEEWRNHIDGDGYREVAPNTYVNNCSHCYLIVTYKDGYVCGWSFSRLKA